MNSLLHSWLRRALFLASVAFASHIGAQGLADQSGELRVGAVTRSYLMHTPSRRPPDGGYRVILAFHGGGGRGAKMVNLMKLDPLADANGIIVVYPDGLGGHWNDGRSSIKTKSDDVGFVTALLDDVEKRYPVNPSKVFAVGISNGAVFTERLGCELSDRIHAIAAVSGTMAAELAPACHPTHPISVLQISGTADPVMPYEGGHVRQFLGTGEGGTVLSAADTVGLWAHSDSCPPPSASETLPQVGEPDRTSIVRQTHSQCRSSAVVTLLTVQGGGHAWPGGRQVAPRIFGRSSSQLDTSKTVVDFVLSDRPRLRQTFTTAEP
jgi:polyhydroxybutyrate depolymerase